VGKRFKPSDNIFHMAVRGKAGISPVVATVILVAVAIVIAIAVAFWASGLVSVFTRFEKIEIQAAYWDGDEVVLIAKNTGSSIAVVDMIFANGAPCLSVAAETGTIMIGDTFSISFGSCGTGLGGSIFTGGVTNEIALHTTSGKTYPVAVLIP
jgi:FlaG/FlaF family flagellin (archaellin)